MQRYPDDDVQFRTDPVNARVDSPLVTLPSGRVVTALPLADGTAPMLGSVFLRASLTRVDAIAALALFGLELPTLEIVREIDRAGLWIPPQTLVFDAFDQQHMPFDDDGNIAGVAHLPQRIGGAQDAVFVLGCQSEPQAGDFGTVEHGDKRGRTIGYPTANLELDGYLRQIGRAHV